MLRHIFKHESIQIVHGHAAFSALAHEALFVGSLLGLGKLPECLSRKIVNKKRLLRSHMKSNNQRTILTL